MIAHRKTDFNHILAFFMIVAFFFPQPRVSGMTLDELQEIAVENRKIVRKYETGVRMGELDEKIVKSRFLPSADLSFTANRLDEDSAVENSENSSLAGTVSYTIFSGFKDSHDLHAATSIKKTRRHELETVVQDIRHSVARRYLDIYGTKNRLKVAEDEYNLLVRRHEDATSRHSVGLIRKNELLRIKVELDNAQQNLKKAGADFKKSVNTMEHEIGQPLNADELAFAEFEKNPEIASVDHYIGLVDQKSDVRALEMMLAAAKSEVLSAKSEYYPQVDASASMRTYGDDYVLGADEGNENELRLQIEASINIFDGFEKYHSVNKAKLNVKRIEYDLDELKGELRTDLKNGLLDCGVSLENLKVAEAAISQAEENLRITDISFKEGVETAADVLDAIYNLSRSKYNHINAKNELFLKYYGLLRLTDGF